jgi:hypothetical protein
MGMTNSESIISKINSNVFFKEFTFSKNDFKALDTNQKLEFADNVVWLDELLFIYQVKEREPNSKNSDIKWFENKILKKAVKQIKSTLTYISAYPEIFIENEKGHKLDITKAKECTDPKKIIVYLPPDNFPESKRHLKFYESADVGLIHLFHSEDYYWVCKYLITPAEIEEYLNFRKDLFLFDKKKSNALAEQYFLAHFLETLDADHFEPAYLENLENLEPDIEQFDVSHIINNFSKNITLINHQTEYYPIIQEVAKLNRSELSEFKKRMSLSIENSESEEIIIPYRIYFPATDCGFVFIPLHSKNTQHWKTALYNFTMLHKYDVKATKCIGVVIVRDQKDLEYFEFYWQSVNEKWVYEEELERALTDDFPFRKTKVKKIDNRYKGNGYK